ncbi:hypothetical protein AAVH_34961, partial [Aphelenchoides avenae]
QIAKASTRRTAQETWRRERRKSVAPDGTTNVPRRWPRVGSSSWRLQRQEDAAKDTRKRRHDEATRDAELDGCDEKERRCYAKRGKPKSAEFARLTRPRRKPTTLARVPGPAGQRRSRPVGGSNFDYSDDDLAQDFR